MYCKSSSISLVLLFCSIIEIRAKFPFGNLVEEYDCKTKQNKTELKDIQNLMINKNYIFMFLKERVLLLEVPYLFELDGRPNLIYKNAFAFKSSVFNKSELNSNLFQIQVIRGRKTYSNQLNGGDKMQMISFDTLPRPNGQFFKGDTKLFYDKLFKFVDFVNIFHYFDEQDSKHYPDEYYDVIYDGPKAKLFYFRYNLQKFFTVYQLESNKFVDISDGGVYGDYIVTHAVVYVRSRPDIYERLKLDKNTVKLGYTLFEIDSELNLHVSNFELNKATDDRFKFKMNIRYSLRLEDLLCLKQNPLTPADVKGIFNLNMYTYYVFGTHYVQISKIATYQFDLTDKELVERSKPIRLSGKHKDDFWFEYINKRWLKTADKQVYLVILGQICELQYDKIDDKKYGIVFNTNDNEQLARIPACPDQLLQIDSTYYCFTGYTYYKLNESWTEAENNRTERNSVRDLLFPNRNVKNVDLETQKVQFIFSHREERTYTVFAFENWTYLFDKNYLKKGPNDSLALRIPSSKDGVRSTPFCLFNRTICDKTVTIF